MHVAINKNDINNYINIVLFAYVLNSNFDLSFNDERDSDAGFDLLLHCWGFEIDFDIFRSRSLCFSISMDPKSWITIALWLFCTLGL